jgi:hypothetical protein
MVYVNDNQLNILKSLFTTEESKILLADIIESDLPLSIRLNVIKNDEKDISYNIINLNQILAISIEQSLLDRILILGLTETDFLNYSNFQKFSNVIMDSFYDIRHPTIILKRRPKDYYFILKDEHNNILETFDFNRPSKIKFPVTVQSACEINTYINREFFGDQLDFSMELEGIDANNEKVILYNFKPIEHPERLENGKKVTKDLVNIDAQSYINSLTFPFTVSDGYSYNQFTFSEKWTCRVIKKKYLINKISYEKMPEIYLSGSLQIIRDNDTTIYFDRFYNEEFALKSLYLLLSMYYIQKNNGYVKKQDNLIYILTTPELCHSMLLQLNFLNQRL